jgi:ribosome assembly protein 4
MATVLPPPSKRQRLETLEKSREQQDIYNVPSDAGSLRIQFFDEATGLPVGKGPVLVPVADATPKNLELLLNTLEGHVGGESSVDHHSTILTILRVLGFLRIYTILIHTSGARK